MVVKCCVKGCNNVQSVDKGVSFHSFPKDENLCHRWMEAVGITAVKKWMQICSVHFSEESINQIFPAGKFQRLKPDAQPLTLSDQCNTESLSGCAQSTACKRSRLDQAESLTLCCYQQQNAVPAGQNEKDLSDETIFPEREFQHLKPETQPLKLIDQCIAKSLSACTPLYECKQTRLDSAGSVAMYHDQSHTAVRAGQTGNDVSDKAERQMYVGSSQNKLSSSTQTDVCNQQVMLQSRGTQCDNLHVVTDRATSPFETGSISGQRFMINSSSDGDSDSDYTPFESQGTLSTNIDSQDSRSMGPKAVISHMARSNSQRYLGLPPQCLFILDLLGDKLQHGGKHCILDSTEIVEIVLRKVRLNESFDILADLYGVSKARISRIFSQYLPLISTYLKDFIIWPSLSEVQMRLPLAFKTRYRNVIAIIDCMEIEIQKPSKPFQQSITWSEYKHANTVKYLISSTPDGTINFVSAGYSGRISDMQLVVESGFINLLQPGEIVMADRGFKSIETLLQQRGCSLCKPPSVSKSEKLPKKLVHEAKVIAALRVHIERVIRRIR